MSDENDTEEKKKAIDYIENAIKEKDDFVKKIVSGFTERVTKEQLCTAIRDSFFRSYLLRLKISGKQLTQAVKESNPQ